MPLLAGRPIVRQRGAAVNAARVVFILMKVVQPAGVFGKEGICRVSRR
jgi:hypothetical protein